LGGWAGPVRSQVVRIVPIEQVLSYEAAQASIRWWWDPASILDGRDYGGGPYDATGGITSVLAINDGARTSSAHSKEPDY
jgi:hypothetical protein